MKVLCRLRQAEVDRRSTKRKAVYIKEHLGKFSQRNMMRETKDRENVKQNHREIEK